MSQQDLFREFLALPADQQQAVAAMIVDYQKKNNLAVLGKVNESFDPANEKFIGMWKDRQDLADSTEWVRKLRANEW
jgi:hypothetical protein